MKIKKAFFGLLGALIIGGLGNGVWEYVLEPAFSWMLHGALNIATLGVQSFKDDLYKEIAKGLHEESSLSLANSINYWFGYAVLVGIFALTRRTKNFITEIDAANKEIDALEAAIDAPQKSPVSKEDLIGRISDLRAKNSSMKPRAKLLYYSVNSLMAIGVAVYAWVLIGVIKDRYINSAIVNYQQSILIIGPLVKEEDIYMLKSEFARISSRDDYKTLMDKIKKIGVDGGYGMPNFNIW